MKFVNVLEADYFGIQFADKEDNLVFLDPTKRIDEQIKSEMSLFNYLEILWRKCLTGSS